MRKKIIIKAGGSIVMNERHSIYFTLLKKLDYDILVFYIFSYRIFAIYKRIFIKLKTYMIKND